MSEQTTEQRERRRRHRQRDRQKEKRMYKTRTQWNSSWKTEEVEDYGTFEEMYSKYGEKNYVYWCAQCPPTRGEHGEYNGYRLDGDEIVESVIVNGKFERRTSKTKFNLARYKRHKAWIANFKIYGKKVILVANAPDISAEQEMRMIMAELDRRHIGWSELEPEIQNVLGPGRRADDFVARASAEEVKRVVLKAVGNIITRRNRANPEHPEEPFFIIAVPRAEMERRASYGTRKTPTKSWVYKRRDE